MLKIALPIVTIALLISCNQQKSADGAAYWASVDSLSYSTHEHKKQLFECDEPGKPCVKVELFRLQIESEGAAADSIKQQVNKRFLNLYGEEQEGQTVHFHVDDVMNDFIDEYAMIVHDMPDYSAEWILERTAEVNFNKLGVFGVSFIDFSYTGGAHGNSLLLYSNFSTAHGAAIHLEDLFHYGDSMRQQTELLFRRSQNISVNTPLNDAGFFFDEQGFYLPDNFFLSDLGVHFFYNPYEIAPYSYGAIEFFMTWKDCEPFLIADWKHLAEILKGVDSQSTPTEA
jgi:hypothetical protein